MSAVFMAIAGPVESRTAVTAAAQVFVVGDPSTTISRAPCRTPLLRASCWANRMPKLMIPNTRTMRMGKTSANSTTDAPSSRRLRARMR